MQHLPQQDHVDLVLNEDDNTEEMRKPPAATSGFQLEPSPTYRGKEKFND